MTDLTISPVRGLPELREGDDLAGMIVERAELQDGDVVVVAQKAISKIEGRIVRLARVIASRRAEPPRQRAIGDDALERPREARRVAGEERVRAVLEIVRARRVRDDRRPERQRVQELHGEAVRIAARHDGRVARGQQRRRLLPRGYSELRARGQTPRGLSPGRPMVVADPPGANRLGVDARRARSR